MNRLTPINRYVSYTSMERHVTLLKTALDHNAQDQRMGDELICFPGTELLDQTLRRK